MRGILARLGDASDLVHRVARRAALRAADEVTAVRTIVRNGIPVDRLDAAIERLRRAEGDVVATAAADAAFHAEAVALAGLPRLSARYSGLIDQIRLVLLASEVEGWGTHDRMTENHIVLLDALRDGVRTGDAREVVRIWEDHVLSGMTVPGILGPL